MKNLLFILPIIAVSFNLQAQKTDYVPASVEEEFLDAVRAGDFNTTASFIPELDLSGELGERALAISLV